MKRFLLVSALCLVFVACSKDDPELYTPLHTTNDGTEMPQEPEGEEEIQNPPKEKDPVPEPTWTWAMAADSSNFALVDQLMDKTKGFFWATSAKKPIERSNIYWQQAHAIDVLVYAYERVKNTNPTLAAEYLGYFTKWFNNKANNWYGGDKKNGFYNQYTDDMAWIALTLLHMADATGNQNYYTTAKTIYDDYMLEPQRILTDEQGWGLIWRLTTQGMTDKEIAESNVRNACTNTPAGVIALKLYKKTGDIKYLVDAQRLYAYMKGGNRVTNAGAVGEPPLTYTQGTWTEMCRLLYRYTGEAKYKTDAETCIKFTFKSGGRCTLANSTILRDEGTDQNQSIFKAVLIPYAVNFCNDPYMTGAARNEVRNALTLNANTLWNSTGIVNVDKSSYAKMSFNYVWNAPFNTANPMFLGAQVSGASLLEGMTRLSSRN